jgi:hypothetical protein
MPGDAKVIAHGRDIVALFEQPAPALTPTEYSALREAISFYLSEWSQEEFMPVCKTLSDLMTRIAALSRFES